MTPRISSSRAVLFLLVLRLFASDAFAQSSSAPTAAAKPRRPQEEAIEKGPLPYQQEVVTFRNDAADISLAGTFSAPSSKQPLPAVLLIAASGRMTRDEPAAGHRVFLVLADYLNRRGIAVFRYDKRGVGESTGSFAAATFDDFVSDAAAATRYLKTRTDVDQKHVGLIGHSEGGSVAPAVAVQDASIAFVVLMAGSGLRGDERVIEQQAFVAHEQGASDEQVAKIRVLYGQLFADARGAGSEQEIDKVIMKAREQAVAQNAMTAQQADETLGRMTAASVRELAADDPLPTLRRVTIPVLALVGSLDRIVPSVPYRRVIRPALSSNKHAMVIELPNLNHVFQTAITGSPREFAQIEETLSPAAMQTIGDWIARQGRQTDDLPAERPSRK